MKSILTVAVLIFTIPCFAQNVKPDKAYEQIGKEVTICGEVKTISSVSNTNETSMLLNFCDDFPNACFTGRILISDFPKFKEEFNNYPGKNICISGTVIMNEDKPEIILKEIEQIKSN
ncbi:MAG TPA: hypothetical protein VK590_04345 [Saprospiraceae bacterium]|nr:hypothetical protein [Saprospiraceae bacterium]